MFEQILEQIKKYNKIIIHRHVRPDGDCIGSQFGLKYYLQLNFPEKQIYAVGDEIPDYLKRCGQNDVISDDIYQGALVIVVDTAVEKRISDERYKLGETIIKIDHHDDSPEYANINYIDPLSPACASILVRMMKEFEEKENYIYNKQIATCLYIAIITDTGRFRFRGVNDEVLINAAWLLKKDVDIEDIYTKLYVKKKESFKLQGYVYKHFKTTSNGVAYIYFTKRIMRKFNITKEDAANLVNSLDSIDGSPIWVVFVDQMLDKGMNSNPKEPSEKEIRVRIRSRFIAINEIATHYRGGGHLQASGATIYSKKEMLNILDELNLLLGQYKNQNPEVF